MIVVVKLALLIVHRVLILPVPVAVKARLRVRVVSLLLNAPPTNTLMVYAMAVTSLHVLRAIPNAQDVLDPHRLIVPLALLGNSCLGYHVLTLMHAAREHLPTRCRAHVMRAILRVKHALVQQVTRVKHAFPPLSCTRVHVCNRVHR